MMVNWLINPLQNPLTGPLTILLGLLFGSAGLALAVYTLAQRTRLTFVNGQVKASSELKPLVEMPPLIHTLWQRYRTWLIIGLAVAGVVLSGPLTLAGLGAFLIWQGGREYAALVDLPELQRRLLIGSGWLTLGGGLVFGPVALLYAPVLAFFGWAALALRPLAHEQAVGQRFGTMTAGLWGYLYLGWLPAHLVGLGMSKMPGLVLAVALGVALSDIGAFCTGKLLKGPKLAPNLSPNKTWGGVAGNFLGAALALALLSFALPGLEWWQFGGLTLVIGLGSIWGDLLESLLKRQHGVKDAGAILPGFGGLLDRIDSLLIVAPLVYYLVLFSF